MNNILFIITKSCVGGAQVFVLDQAKILSKSGSKIHIATNQEDWLTYNLNQFISNKLINKSIEKYFSIIYLLKLIKFIKNNNIELIICNSANAGLYGRIAAFITNKHSIYVTHGWSSIYNGGKLKFLYNIIEKLLSIISSSVLCISENDYLIAINKIKIKPKKCFIITNSIYPPQLKITSPRKSSNCIEILTVCRLAYPKLPMLLIDSVKNMLNFNLTIVGDGPNFKEIVNYIRENKIQNIFLLGEIPKFNNFIKFDIFCLLSESEGLPMAGIEAMSFGLPLVLSNVGGCPELIENNGYLVSNEIGDIQNAISNSFLNKKMFSEASISLFNRKFNLTTKEKDYLNYFNRFLNQTTKYGK